MQEHDYEQFALLFNQLLAYYPECKLNPSLVLDGYFEDLRMLRIEHIGPFFTEVRRRRTWFPKPAEMLQLLRELQAEAKPVEACPRCPSGHGPHTGHRVSHYPAGPWCDTCNADMPTPAGYLTMPPASRARPDAEPVQLPEYSRTPLRQEEVRELIRGVMTVLDKKSERLRGMADWVPLTNAERLATRRDELRHQAREMTDEAN